MPKSSRYSPTRKSRMLARTWVADSISVIRELSVSSSFRVSGGIPVSARTRLTPPNRLGSVKLLHGKVHIHAKRRSSRVFSLPDFQLAARFPKNPLSDGDNQTGFLGDRNKPAGDNRPRRGWRHRSKLSNPTMACVARSTLGWYTAKSSPRSASAQIDDSCHAGLGSLVHGSFEHLPTILPGFLGAVHGEIGFP